MAQVSSLYCTFEEHWLTISPTGRVDLIICARGGPCQDKMFRGCSFLGLYISNSVIRETKEKKSVSNWTRPMNSLNCITLLGCCVSLLNSSDDWWIMRKTECQNVLIFIRIPLCVHNHNSHVFPCQVGLKHFTKTKTGKKLVSNNYQWNPIYW